MRHPTAGRQARQIELLRGRFAQADGLPFTDVLPAEQVERAFREEGAWWRDVVYPPVLTLWAFLGQVCSADGSCRAAVARVLAWLVARGQRPCAPETGPYCKARGRLPEGLVRRLARQTGRTLHEQAPADWLWHGRRVKVVDGTTVTLPDTGGNQAAYPQLASQPRGAGFPIARLVVVFCLACGTALDAALGRYQGQQTGETALLRSLDDAFEPGDVLLADRAYGGYFDLAHWQQRGLDVVVRLHQRRRCPAGPGGHAITWTKPDRPAWMSAAEYARVPERLELRAVRVSVHEPGFRTRSLVVVTTLRDARAYPAGEVAELYRRRWHAELDLRSLKVTLGMDMLRCKSPAMVRKEVWARLLAYNLIRTVLAQAAAAGGVAPRELSFKGAVQTLAAFAERLQEAEAAVAAELHAALLRAVGSHRVGDRPGRVEPRARKRRPKRYPTLHGPRAAARTNARRTA